MGRGGKRPGAGAPRGNLNGFKHGRNSQQHQKLLQLIARDPEALAMLRDLAEHNDRRRKRLRKQAEQLLELLLDRAQQARGGSHLSPDELNQTLSYVGLEDPAQLIDEIDVDLENF